MISLNRLRVSLTKNGYQKIWELIRRFPVDEILDNTNGSLPNIHIDRTQTRKILSGRDIRSVASYWERAKALDDKSIKTLLFVSIVFSHHELLAALRNAGGNEMKTFVSIESFPGGKTYTNFKYAVWVLGMSPYERKSKGIQLDYSPIFESEDVGLIAFEIIKEKLRYAGWDGAHPIEDVVEELGIHKVLSVDLGFFREWVKSGFTLRPKMEIVEVVDPLVDEEFNKDFSFKAGKGKWKKTALRSSRTIAKVIDLKHKRIQESIYAELCGIHGKENVGLEVSTGYGTAVDVVVKQGDDMIFYEVKISPSAKMCLREALAQLLEYSYWGNAKGRAKRLIIVGAHDAGRVGEKYLRNLRKNFSIPVCYQTFDEVVGRLGKIV